MALFLFTDLLVVAKRKSEERFVVLDYSPRNMIQVTLVDMMVMMMMMLIMIMTRDS